MSVHTEDKLTLENSNTFSANSLNLTMGVLLASHVVRPRESRGTGSFFFILFKSRSPFGCLRTHFVDQTDLKLREIHLSAFLLL